MPAKLCLIGKRFGRWFIYAEAPQQLVGSNPPQLHSFSWGHCDCGVEKIIRNSLLTSGHSKSCGCYNIQVLKLRSTKHGKRFTRAYKSWADMIQRTTNKNNSAYFNYGARGIKTCERWMTFENFFEDKGECPKGMTIERINNDGDYEPSNCIWGTRKIQNRNTRRNRVVTVNGKTGCISELCELFGKNHQMVRMRLHRGWSVERAFS